MAIIYRTAESRRDMEQIFCLNYETFVEEIPQHEPNEARLLVDRFHEENTYVVAMDGDRLAGMLAVRGRRPFSLDAKIEDFERLLPGRPERMVEIRLLAVDKAYRGTRLLHGLIRYLDRYMETQEYEMAVISGTTRELKLYEHLGFVPFGGLVGSGQALYQPMYLTPATYEASRAYELIRQSVSFLAGPVEIRPAVTQGLLRRPIPHRSRAFRRLQESVSRKLKAMTGADAVHIMLGSGTLANDVVAGELRRTGGRGLILVNGEFGHRLLRHAERWELNYDVLESPYGEPFDYKRVEAAAEQGNYTWMWAVHGETSTGVLNDLERLKAIAGRYQLKLAADCVSSLGAVPVNLSGVNWASSVSGKALGSYTGLSFVLEGSAGQGEGRGESEDQGESEGEGEKTSSLGIPPYVDAALYRFAEGVPFSQSSNLLGAMDAALDVYEQGEPYAVVSERGRLLRESVEAMGLRVLAAPEHQTPYLVTVVLPERLSSRELGEHMAFQGFELQYESEYLLARNWVQIACLGALKNSDMRRMLEHLRLYVQGQANQPEQAAVSRMAFVME
ncbi:aspartate aminotransferase [Paenibacillus sp. UNCCL117]|uniref:GNAT family N-acetyltransferase n=1 Tax=unclassified Paenibacillus TaxID=185978 RepID=UPI00087F50BC|nr:MULTISPECIES: GNAT family N-acetyltransferase [unclassified Paenibacillus]SDD18391.1 aspartate aminotransferase [Paenibacillus sp. cl123]SFW35223.1 aspartate aminotransferase [Paenibacillus sp. UNCCL117]